MNIPENASVKPPVPEQLSILFVGTQMALGGAQRLLIDQARWFRSRGHRVSAAFFYDKEGLAEAWSAEAGFPIIALSSLAHEEAGMVRVGRLMSGLGRLWRLLRKEKFDVIETFTYDSNILALPLAWLAGIPVRIATHHGIIEGFPRMIERLHGWLVNAGLASILVNVSRKVLEQAAAAGIRREHMTVIQNGIALDQRAATDNGNIRNELGLGENDVIILSVGRLVYQKGHEYLIQALPDLLGEFPAARVVICGEGPLRSQLEAQVVRLGVSGSVRLTGNRMDIQRFLQSADIFVLPSRWEGLPVALLEAMASGLPVVATRVEGVEEVIQDSSQGTLVAPEDSRALRAALMPLLASPTVRHTIGAEARARVREAYTIDIMCEKYAALMHNLLERSGRHFTAKRNRPKL